MAKGQESETKRLQGKARKQKALPLQMDAEVKPQDEKDKGKTGKILKMLPKQMKARTRSPAWRGACAGLPR